MDTKCSFVCALLHCFPPYYIAHLTTSKTLPLSIDTAYCSNKWCNELVEVTLVRRRTTAAAKG